MYSVNKTGIVLLGDGIHGGIESNGIGHHLHTHSSLNHASFVVILHGTRSERRMKILPKSERSVLSELGNIGISNKSTRALNGELLDIAIVARNKIRRDLANDRLSSSSLGFRSDVLEPSKITKKPLQYPSHA